MANANFTANKDIESVLNRIVEFRKQILNSGYDSLFTHGNVNEKRRISDHMTMCGMIDELCEAMEGEMNHV
jgi:hypothetical protein